MIDMLVEQIEAYIEGAISCEELEEWLAASLDMILEAGDWDAQVLADSLDGDLQEVSQGRLSEDALKSNLGERLAMWRREQGGIPGET